MMEQLHFFDWFGETEVQAAPRKKTEETPQKIIRRTQKKTESQAKIVPKKEASQKRTTVRKAAEESSLPSKENLDLAWKLCCLVCDIPYNKRSEEAPLLYGYSIANPKELAKDLDTKIKS